MRRRYRSCSQAFGFCSLRDFHSEEPCSYQQRMRPWLGMTLVDMLMCWQ